MNNSRPMHIAWVNHQLKILRLSEMVWVKVATSVVAPVVSVDTLVGGSVGSRLQQQGRWNLSLNVWMGIYFQTAAGPTLLFKTLQLIVNMEHVYLPRVWLTESFICVVENIIEVPGNLLAQRLGKRSGVSVTPGGKGATKRRVRGSDREASATAREIP